MSTSTGQVCLSLQSKLYVAHEKIASAKNAIEMSLKIHNNTAVNKEIMAELLNYIPGILSDIEDCIRRTHSWERRSAGRPPTQS